MLSESSRVTGVGLSVKVLGCCDVSLALEMVLELRLNNLIISTNTNQKFYKSTSKKFTLTLEIIKLQSKWHMCGIRGNSCNGANRNNRGVSSTLFHYSEINKRPQNCTIKQ
eukprot:XP_766150.1 hypothetical protein [Theileria parva strain Muguga]